MSNKNDFRQKQARFDENVAPMCTEVAEYLWTHQSQLTDKAKFGKFKLVGKDTKKVQDGILCIQLTSKNLFLRVKITANESAGTYSLNIEMTNGSEQKINKYEQGFCTNVKDLLTALNSKNSVPKEKKSSHPIHC
jgi:hypothetical protein